MEAPTAGFPGYFGSSVELCPNKEGWGPWSTERLLDLTPCFEYGTIVLGLQALFIVVASLRIRSSKSLDPLPVEFTKSHKYTFKRGLIFLAGIASLLRLGHEVVYGETQLRVSILSIALVAQTVGIFLAFSLQRYEQTYSRLSSSPLLLYWLTSIIVGILVLYTSAGTGARERHPADWVLQIILIVLYAAAFVLEVMPRKSSGSYYLLADNEDDSAAWDNSNISPEDEANIFSKLTFSWMSPLLSIGYKRPITADDLWPLPKNYLPYMVADQFDDAWNQEIKRAEAKGGKSPSLLWAMAKTFGVQFGFAGFLKACQDVLQFTQPILLSRLINFVSSYSTENPQPMVYGYFYAVSMFVTATVQTLFLHQYFQYAMCTGIRVRSGLVTAIYSKSMLLSNSARQTYSVGDIVNRMSVDATRISDLTNYGHIMWSGPFQIIMALALLYNTLGWSVFAGVLIMILSIPINGWVTRRMSRLQKAQMKNKDERMKLMDESLGGMKVIKLYAWGKAFLDRIRYVRNEKELVTLKQYGYTSATQNVIMIVTPFIVSITTFAIYALLDGKSRGPLDAQLIFVSVSLFNLLRFPLAVFPNVITAMVEASVALDRIYKFMTCEELDPNVVVREDYVRRGKSAGSETLVKIDNGTFSWTSNPSEFYKPAIENIDLEVKSDELLAIVGRVGSGKSSIISSLLGEMYKIDGEVYVRGRIAYVPQQPWIMNATLRENILFGHSYDPAFYKKVLSACALNQDIDMLPGGDMTEIGEKGINLSGGQRARVALARAVYARADVYLFDDPLSAVDAHVGRHIFNNVLGPNGLLKSRARILVTHAIHFLDQCDTVTMMRDGKVLESGPYQEAIGNIHGELAALIREFGENSSQTPTPVQGLSTAATPSRQSPKSGSPKLQPSSPSGFLDENTIDPEFAEEDEIAEPYEEGAKLHKARRVSMASTIPRASIAPFHRSISAAAHRRKQEILANQGDSDGNSKPTVAAAGDVLMTEEAVRTGSIGWGVYRAYFESCGTSGMILFAFAMIATQAATVGGNVWLKVWAADNAKYTDPKEPNPHGPVYYLAVYFILGAIGGIFVWWRSILLWAKCAIHSAESTHESMLVGVFRSPMSFFDTTPLGRILNRFSKDQYTIDEVLPRSFSSWAQTFLMVVFSIGVIISAMPAYILVILPLTGVYLMLQRYYLTSSRELKRLDSVSRSPIYAHFQETLGGLSTIRAYNQGGRFMAENERRLEYNQRAYYPYLSLNRWLAVRLEFIGALLIFAAALLGVIALKFGSIDASLVGLAVSYSLNITQNLNWCIRMYSEVETNIVSMERIMEYTDLKTEAPEIVPDSRPAPAWPTKGEVVFDSYSTRYREGLDLVLNDISFKIKPREKIGIVGRTGAGKSSLTLSLFRIIEAAAGEIKIDGVDISKIGLHDLRSRLGIIPQDPTIFSGTLRENLDPFNQHDDLALWHALEQSHLKELILSKEGQLDTQITQGGENLSVGQRQLVCLARALLRRASVLVLDEATAAIDVETDKIIQETIRKEFKHFTILTIAHRLNTILDSDRILVMDSGKVAEFDTPKNLLADPTSIFYGMAKEANIIDQYQ
ncbi:hypothetical protein H4219_003711 [Mycoemilia scoparia]|uniref:Metal resistance protein YCF1 n=1 Tax=Mycoemilia scoparia TaxID=417184 RepID=A0A9W8A1Y9_9FUNG|nr:hypothetical protein H4219_003711 [Mycoemilia scoparia]